MRKIAVTDIHGCSRTFRALLEEQVVLDRKDELYLLGDYIDRGHDSKGVLDHIMELREAGYVVKCLKGNHEEMMIEAAEGGDTEVWLFNGGKETLDSFKTNDVSGVDEKYFRLLKSFDHYLEVDDYILVHAGLNFVGQDQGDGEEDFLWKLHNPLRDTHSMMWIRYWYKDIDWAWLNGRRIIHGHTPITLEEIWDMYDLLNQDQVLDIDNGCFAKYSKGLGQLCAFDMTQQELYFQENID
jgi:serine/threonine protein phosphatase 1